MTARRALIVATLALLLTGCGSGAGGQYVDSVTVNRVNGGSVECVSQEHGLDCNWDEATQ